MTFGKEVRDLLHFERTFESNREVELPAEEQKTVRIRISAGNFLDLSVQLQNRFNLFGQSLERFDDACPFRCREISHPPEKQSEKGEDSELLRKRLGSRYANLRPSVHVNAAVAFTRDGACDVVANSKGTKTFAPAFTQRAERVRGFAALTDGEDQRLRRHRRVAMAKLARVIHFGWDARHSLNQIFADSCGMQCSAASGENDSPDIAQLRRPHVQSAELCRGFFRVETPAHRVANRVRLLKDFLEHVMGIIPFADIFGCEIDFADRMLCDVTGKRTNLEFIGSDRDDIEVI